MELTCGTSKIAGASFSIYPMSDDFVDIILNALKEVDTSKVWVETDDVTTTVRGKLVHVFDVTAAMFLHAAKTGKHVGLQVTYSLGCPGDSTGDVFMAEDDVRLNQPNFADLKQYVAAKFSLYPLGGGQYMDIIYSQIEAMRAYVEVSKAHYSTRLHGEAVDVFKGLESVFQATVDGGSSHTVMTVSISANSPSHVE
ncbi:YkoF family thiamine/hydroxymethylpyrimidine-binding protein [Ornithinibacillus sp. 4-3]|uniref:YkoF family thiamine/hydroxymethylpyrimidine-binding protein n=1 Tax=Ornithinibacillus sp. 4-3 TaxID=3231488 RepID=A0AB39HRS3_9BACI